MRPLHVHLSEQVAENDACLAAYGCTPDRAARRARCARRALQRRTRHAPHDRDIRLLGERGGHACFCPTTERDLGDGIGTVGWAATPLALGSRWARTATRSSTRSRRCGRSSSTSGWRRSDAVTGQAGASCSQAATATGHASLGFRDAGRISPSAQWADLVTLDARVHPHRRQRSRCRRRWCSRRLQPTSCMSSPADGRSTSIAPAIGRELESGDRHGLGRADDLPARAPVSASWSPTTPHLGDGSALRPRIRTTRRSSSRAAGSVWVGAPQDAPAADDRARSSRAPPSFPASSTATPIWSSPVTGRRSSPPGWRDVRTRRAASGRRSPRPGPRRTRSWRRNAARLVAEMARAGHDHGRDQERLRPDRRATRRARWPSPAQLTAETTFLGAHVVPPRVRRRRRRLRRPRHRADAGGLRAARPLGRRLLRAGRLRRRPGAGGAPRRSGGRSAAADPRQPARRGPGRHGGVRGGCRVRRPLHVRDGRRHREPARRRRRGDPAARWSSSPPARPTRTRRACSTAGVTVALATDCNPGSCYTSSMPLCMALAVREMRMSPGRGALVGDGRRCARAAPRRRRASRRSGRGPTSPCWRRRRTCTSPIAPASRWSPRPTRAGRGST